MKALNPSTGNLEKVYVKALDGMPVGSQVEFTGSTIPTGWEEVNDYSTTEMDTGKKWIDGKSIYRIVFTGTTSSSQNYVSNTLSFDTIVNTSGYIVNGTCNNMLGLYLPDTPTYVGCYGDKQNSLIYLHYSNDLKSKSYTIIVEYTKSS